MKRLEEFFLLLENDLATVPAKDEIQSFAVARQRTRAKKRADLGDSSLSPIAIKDFIALNQQVGDCVLSISTGDADNARAFIRMALERYSSAASELNIQETLDRVHLLDLWGFGPGASFDTKGTHPAEKIGQRWTTTSSALSEVQRLRRNHPYLSARDSIQGDGTVIVRGSKLTTVPKNEEKERTIAVEPLGNMCLQLALGKYLEGALRCVGLDIRNQQPKNKDMARLGSLNGDLCTMDLASASDRIKPDLVRLLLPPEWYEILMAVRSPETLLPNGEWLTLNMISTMGNGFTFPLMTLLIVSLVYALRCREKRSPNLWLDWSKTCVFGDDIIVPSDEFLGLTELLEASGFAVNTDKSYFEGPFRESCGGDFYLGRDVTPFYVKSLESDAEIYVALNKMVEWSAKVQVTPLQAYGFLFRELGHRLNFVPEWEQPTAGFRCTQVQGHYKKLVPKQHRVRLKDEFFLLPLACAGYVVNSADGPFYLPRSVKTRYRAIRSRLPRGYLDGRAPDLRSYEESSHADFIGWLGLAAFPKTA